MKCAWESLELTIQQMPGRELHAVYPLLSLSNNRRIRLEVSVPDADPHIPSVVEVWAGNTGMSARFLTCSELSLMATQVLLAF